MMPSRSHSSRREFVATLTGASAALIHSQSLFSAEPDPRLAKVLADTIAVDMHSHVGIPFGRPNAPLSRFDIAGELKRTGFTTVIQTYEVDSVRAGPGEDYTHNLEALDFEDRLLAAGRVGRALSLKELKNAHARGQPMIIQAAEGAQFLEGRIERVEEAYLRGLRVLQLVHERDATVRPLADIYTRAARFGGLTDFGAETIRACNRLGIVIDLTHMSYDAVKAALKISTRPMLFSHTSMQPEPGERSATAMMAPRLLGKEEARDIAKAGGVIGVWCHGSNTAREYVAMVKRVVETVGVDHVGIGTDSNLEPDTQRIYTNAIWKNETRGFFPAVAAEMLGAGFTAAEVAAIGGGNFCRVFGAVTGA
jgi:membrane dipeptidase